MALDRFVHFDEKNAPSDEDIESVIRNFFGGAGMKFDRDTAAQIERYKDRWIISLPGAGSFPFASLENTLHKPQPERWIEIVPGNPLDVITRRQDEYTNVLAKGIADMFARYWEGTVDE